MPTVRAYDTKTLTEYLNWMKSPLLLNSRLILSGSFDEYRQICRAVGFEFFFVFFSDFLVEIGQSFRPIRFNYLNEVTQFSFNYSNTEIETKMACKQNISRLQNEYQCIRAKAQYHARTARNERRCGVDAMLVEHTLTTVVRASVVLPHGSVD